MKFSEAVNDSKPAPPSFMARENSTPDIECALDFQVGAVIYFSET
ncbi:MAG: hypothetical protein PHS86_11710 [Syntrophaceae bacterium]|jgi:hypothetical protein|nr:hypothetical protein [Syntrophaceae bacterium]